VILLTWPLYLTLLIFRGPLLQVFQTGVRAGRSTARVVVLSMIVATGCGLVDVVLSMAGHVVEHVQRLRSPDLQHRARRLLIPGHGVLGAIWSAAICLRNLAAATRVGLALLYIGRSRCSPRA
jgi:hypothetical protein